MKKLIAIFTSLILVLTLCATAFATDTADVTLNDSSNRIYKGYKLLKLTTSLKGEGHHPTACTDDNHTSDCYNYAYTVNETYRPILQAETLANGRNELWTTTGKPSTFEGVTDEQILEYLSYQTGDNGDVYNTMRQVADRIYRAILANEIEADASNLSGDSNVTINQGYWMFADVTPLSGNAANSLVVVDTKGQSNLTITPKTALPTVEKKVKDIEDSEDSSIEDNPWHDSADHDIGDVVPFKLTATLPSNAQYYQSYKMVFHDTLSAGLTLDPTSIKVLMYETKHKADVDTDLNDALKDVTSSFAPIITNPTDGCSFEVACNNVFTIAGVTKDTAFVVYYKATLNENAVIGAAGNPNKVYLEFSNNPYGNGTGKTEEDTVIVFTYQLVINKIDSHNHPLEGAGFILYKKDVNESKYYVFGLKDSAGNKIQVPEEENTAKRGEYTGGTTFTWTGLDDGDYKLVESTVPAGYNPMSAIAFSISATHDETGDDPKLTVLDGGLVMGRGDVSTGKITKDIVNNTGVILPETGAKGTLMLIGGGSMFVLVAAVFMITRKKMSVYED